MHALGSSHAIEKQIIVVRAGIGFWIRIQFKSSLALPSSAPLPPPTFAHFYPFMLEQARHFGFTLSPHFSTSILDSTKWDLTKGAKNFSCNIIKAFPSFEGYLKLVPATIKT